MQIPKKCFNRYKPKEFDLFIAYFSLFSNYTVDNFDRNLELKKTANASKNFVQTFFNKQFPNGKE